MDHALRRETHGQVAVVAVQVGDVVDRGLERALVALEPLPGLLAVRLLPGHHRPSGWMRRYIIARRSSGVGFAL